MNERTEFIVYLYQTCEMGVTSTKTLIDLLQNKENKILEYLNRYLKEYEKYFETVKSLIKENDIEVKKASMIGKMMSSISMNMDLMKDNSDAKVADILIQGYNMGIIELTKKIKKYKKFINKEEKNLAEKINKTQEENIKELKKFL